MATENFTLSKRILLLIGLAALIGILVWKFFIKDTNPCSDKIKKYQNAGSKCNGPGIFVMKNIGDTVNKETELKYVCNQIILDKEDKAHGKNVDFLLAKCFKRVDSCACGGRFELYEAPENTPIDVGTVTSTGTPNNKPVGIFNYYLEFDSTTTINGRLKTEAVLNCVDEDSVKVAILDSGVKLDSDPARGHLINNQWSAYNQSLSCMPTSNPFGVNCVRGMSTYMDPPQDLMGHGTSVNGVVVGSSIPNFSTKLKLYVNNIAIFNPEIGSGTLFDALCALQYAIQQKPNVINMSWGFAVELGNSHTGKDTMLMMMREAFASIFESAPHILFVAGAGNNGRELDNFFHFIPGSMADVHRNLISVGSVDVDGTDIAWFSNYADPTTKKVTLYGPGDKIVAPFPTNLGRLTSNGWLEMSGTSYSTPLVTRCASVLLNRHMPSADVKIFFSGAAAITPFASSSKGLSGLPGLKPLTKVNEWLCPVNQ